MEVCMSCGSNDLDILAGQQKGPDGKPFTVEVKRCNNCGDDHTVWFENGKEVLKPLTEETTVIDRRFRLNRREDQQRRHGDKKWVEKSATSPQSKSKTPHSGPKGAMYYNPDVPPNGNYAKP